MVTAGAGGAVAEAGTAEAEVGPPILSQEVEKEEDEGHTDYDGGNPPSETCPVPLENCGSTGLVNNLVLIPV